MDFGQNMFAYPDSKDPSRIAFKMRQAIPDFQETFTVIEKVN